MCAGVPSDKVSDQSMRSIVELRINAASLTKAIGSVIVAHLPGPDGFGESNCFQHKHSINA